MPDYFDVMYILSVEFLWRVGLIVTVAWFPIFMAKKIVEKLDPSDVKKVLEGKDLFHSENF